MIPCFAAEEVTCFSRERHVHADDFTADAQRIDDFARLFAQERRRLECVHTRRRQQFDFLARLEAIFEQEACAAPGAAALHTCARYSRS